jgi:hypothetical protein
MLYPHSLLWHYLWVGPDFLLAILAILVWRRGLHKVFPAFFVYLVFEATQRLNLYVIDRLPSMSDDTYWRADIIAMVIETFVKLAVIRELFSDLIRSRPSLAGMGNRLIIGTGAVLVALAIVAAACAPVMRYALLSHANILEQTIYLVEAGLLLFIFLFAARFRLDWDRRYFGIALGLSISACVGLGVSAINANKGFFEKHYLLDLFNMATYHVCVLIWFYYLLSPAWPRTSANVEVLSEMKRIEGAGSTVRRIGLARLLSEN